MQLTNLLLSLFLATAVVAKGDKGAKNGTAKAVTTKSQCREMAKLTSMVELASNTTKLDAKLKNNATKIAEFEAKAAEAQTKLTAMSSNTTLTSECAVIAAAQKTEDDCEDIADWQKIVAIAGNSTALAAKAKGNSTKEAEIQAKATKASAKIAEMSSNTTLTAMCATIAQTKAEKKAAKEAAKSNATTESATTAQAATASTSAASMLDMRASIIGTIVLVAAGMMML